MTLQFLDVFLVVATIKDRDISFLILLCLPDVPIHRWLFYFLYIVWAFLLSGWYKQYLPVPVCNVDTTSSGFTSFTFRCYIHLIHLTSDDECPAIVQLKLLLCRWLNLHSLSSFFAASNEISILQRWNQIPHVLIMFKGVNVSQCNSLNPLWHTAGCWGSRRSQAGWSQDLQDRCEAGGADRPSVPELPGWPWEWSNVGFDKSDKYVKRPTRKDKTNQKAGWWWWWWNS